MYITTNTVNKHKLWQEKLLVATIMRASCGSSLLQGNCMRRAAVTGADFIYFDLISQSIPLCLKEAGLAAISGQMVVLAPWATAD